MKKEIKKSDKARKKTQKTKAVKKTDTATNKAVKEASSSSVLSKLFKKKNEKRPISKSQAGSIPYDTVYENGIIEICPGLFSKSYRISSMNFRTATDQEQWNIGKSYANFIGSFEKEAMVEVTLFNRTMDIEKFKSEVLLEMGTDELNLYREEYNNMLLEKMSGTKNNLETDRLLTISIPAENIKEASEKFGQIDMTVGDTMAQITKSDCVPLSIVERLEILNQIYNMDDAHPLYQKREIAGHTVESFSLENCEKQGISTQDVLVPGQLTFGEFDKKMGQVIRIGNFIAKPYYISNYPTWIKGTTLSDFATLSGNMIASIYFDSKSQSDAAQMLKDKTRSIRSGIITRQRDSSTTTDVSIIAPDLSDAKREADDLQESISQDDARIFYATAVFVLFARTGEELKRLEENLETIANKNLLTVRPLSNQLEQGFNSALPLGNKFVSMDRLMTTETVASMSPFDLKEIYQRSGLYYGLNASSKSMLLYDRTNDINPCGIILGMPGAGKSFSAKREMVSVYLGTGDDIYIVDPEGEYVALAERFGGTVIKIANGSTSHINPFDLNMENSGEDGDPVKVKSDFIQSLCEIAIGGKWGLSPIEQTLIGRCATKLYEEHVRYLHVAGKRMDQENAPTMVDFYNLLMSQPEPEAVNIALALERFATGSDDVFSYKTNVDPNSRMVVYDIKEIGSGLKELGLQIAFDAIWNKMIENKAKGKRTWFYIDEFYLLMAKESSANYISQIWKRARKWNGIPTAITQNVEDMLKSEQARTVINNSQFTTILQQSPINRRQLSELLGLTAEEQKYISTSKPGMGLLKIGEDVIPMNDDFPRDTNLYKIMTTKPDESLNV